MKETLQKIDELTNAGDLASGFQYHELLNKQSKKAETITRVAASSKDANTILTNTIEYRMKAAGDIAEYEQAQVLKNTLEVTYCFKSNIQSYIKQRDSVLQCTSSIPSQTIVSYSEALTTALQLSNYLTDCSICLTSSSFFFFYEQSFCIF